MSCKICHIGYQLKIQYHASLNFIFCNIWWPEAKIIQVYPTSTHSPHHDTEVRRNCGSHLACRNLWDAWLMSLHRPGVQPGRCPKMTGWSGWGAWVSFCSRNRLPRPCDHAGRWLKPTSLWPGTPFSVMSASLTHFLFPTVLFPWAHFLNAPYPRKTTTAWNRHIIHKAHKNHWSKTILETLPL